MVQAIDDQTIEAERSVNFGLNLAPFTEEELFDQFHSSLSISKHLLTIYSLAVGINAKQMIDIGLGSTTKAIRMAAARTGGIVHSCDYDVERFSPLLESQDDQWRLNLGLSDAFLKLVDGPIDFVMHDGAHDYHQVKLDLELILPKMRTFGLICIHDTQQPDLCDEMLAAIRDATKEWKVSLVNLPFGAGLAIIRVESGIHPAITPCFRPLADGRSDTFPVPHMQSFSNGTGTDGSRTSIKDWVVWKARRTAMSYELLRKGLRLVRPWIRPKRVHSRITTE